MKTFEDFRQAAVERKGGEAALEEAIGAHDYGRDISEMNDDRILAEFSKRVFQAGFNWSVIEKKWEGFETGFHAVSYTHLTLPTKA